MRTFDLHVIQYLGPLYTTSQDHESLGSNNSILYPLLDLGRYFIKLHLSSKRQVWFWNCMEYFDGLGPRKWCHVDA
jgi:hypothetical protein